MKEFSQEFYTWLLNQKDLINFRKEYLNPENKIKICLANNELNTINKVIFKYKEICYRKDD